MDYYNILERVSRRARTEIVNEVDRLIESLLCANLSERTSLMCDCDSEGCGEFISGRDAGVGQELGLWTIVAVVPNDAVIPHSQSKSTGLIGVPSLDKTRDMDLLEAKYYPTQELIEMAKSYVRSKNMESDIVSAEFEATNAAIRRHAIKRHAIRNQIDTDEVLL